MILFWSFWIPANAIFWMSVASKVDKPTTSHYQVAALLAFISGVMPYILWKTL